MGVLDHRVLVSEAIQQVTGRRNIIPLLPTHLHLQLRLSAGVTCSHSRGCFHPAPMTLYAIAYYPSPLPNRT